LDFAIISLVIDNMAPTTATQLVLSPKEYQLLVKLVHKRSSTQSSAKVDTTQPDGELPKDNFNAASFRSAARVYLATSLTLKGADALLTRIASRRAGTAVTRKSLVTSRHRLALSLSSLLFFHRVLFRLFARLRLQLLHEKVKDIKARYPKVYAALTSKFAPAIGASLSGLALGICPSDQLRVTISIFFLVRGFELIAGALEAYGYMKNKPSWLGSWLLFPIANGQLLHAFVFDRDCFPSAYGSLIINSTPEYIQRRPEGLSHKVTWPSTDNIVDAVAEMARLRWPPFVSPILNPGALNTLPPSIDPIISPITSRAHPALQHLSCALIHPSETSCFMAYLRQNLLGFPKLARFFTLYYGAFSLLRITAYFKAPVATLNKLAKQVLQTTMALSTAISASWGSICFFNAVLPKKFIPRFRFALGGFLAGTAILFDMTPSGYANSLYAARTSIDSLWKVGVKRGWWRPIKGGDVYLFVASLAVYNIVYDLSRPMPGGTDRAMSLVKLLRGEIEIGLQPNKGQSDSEKISVDEKKSA
jgi:hypothetical protein